VDLSQFVSRCNEKNFAVSLLLPKENEAKGFSKTNLRLITFNLTAILFEEQNRQE